MNRFNKDDIVMIRNEGEPAKVVNIISDDDDYYYEVEAINLINAPHREIKECDLRTARRIVDFNDDRPWRYFDKDWNELYDGDIIEYPDGKREKLYLTNNNRLGVDATNKKWIETGRAVPCEYGIYPLNHDDVTYCVKVKEVS